jgi:DNA-binding helix-hairpin-helix protein with protein kinase domain
MKRLTVVALLLPLGGCVSTASHIVMAPVHAAGWTVDKMTTSQSEADRNRGRRERKQEERERKQAKKDAKRQRELEKRQAREGEPGN